MNLLPLSLLSHPQQNPESSLTGDHDLDSWVSNN